MRAYPANAKNSRPAACSTPGDAGVVAERSREASTSPNPRTTHHDRGEHGEHDRDDDAGEQRRLLDAGVVDRRQRDHRGHRDGVRIRGPGVDSDRQRHGRARGRLADDEAPAGGVTPELAEPLAAVHVGSAGLRIQRGQPRGRRRIAVGDDRRDRQSDEQARPGRRCGRGQRDEDSCADHRAEPDRHGVDGAEPPLQRRAVRRAHRTDTRSGGRVLSEYRFATPHGGGHEDQDGEHRIEPITTSGIVHSRRTISAVSHCST